MSRSPEFLVLSDAASTIQPGSRYRHFKGDEYRVFGVGKHTETLEEFVVYQPVTATDTILCVRPLGMFLDQVYRPDYTGPRFTCLGDK